MQAGGVVDVARAAAGCRAWAPAARRASPRRTASSWMRRWRRLGDEAALQLDEARTVRRRHAEALRHLLEPRRRRAAAARAGAGRSGTSRRRAGLAGVVRRGSASKESSGSPGGACSGRGACAAGSRVGGCSLGAGAARSGDATGTGGGATSLTISGDSGGGEATAATAGIVAGDGMTTTVGAAAGGAKRCCTTATTSPRLSPTESERRATAHQRLTTGRRPLRRRHRCRPSRAPASTPRRAWCCRRAARSPRL